MRKASTWLRQSLRTSLEFALGIAVVSNAFVASTHGQFETGRVQPYVPSVVGGLPPGSKGLEQPVYIASAQDLAPAGVSSLEFSRYIDEAPPPGMVQADIPEHVPEPELDYKLFAAGDLVAVVGQEPVLIGHLIDPKRVTPDLLSHPGFEGQFRKILIDTIHRKALAQRFVDQQVTAKSVKEREAAKQQVKKKVAEAFYTEYIPFQVKEMKLETPEEFYKLVSKEGRSLQSMQQSWAEQMLAMQVMKSDRKPVVELSELQDHYDANLDDFKHPAKVRFEILTAEFKKYGNRQAAYNAVGEMGNQVFFGKPFETVAKESSSGWAASDGGQVNWTRKGALKSKPIDEAIFSPQQTPVNKLSDIIEDTEGFHIIRVIERQEEFTQPFPEVQAEIRKKIVKQKESKVAKDLEAKILSETPIWTRWPEDIPGSMPLSDLLQ